MCSDYGKDSIIMNNKAWKNIFTQTIRSRGLEYYNTGCVEELEWDEDTRSL